jgi:2-keto-4-pentenoate hydratase
MSPTESEQAASLLLKARADRQWLTELPEACRPRHIGDAYDIQARVASRLGGAIQAWKVGAGSLNAEPACAAITERTLFKSGVTLSRAMFNIVGLEAEIAYRFGRALEPGQVHSMDDVAAAVESVHPAIEISDTRFTKWASQDRPSHVADQLNHGALVVGEGTENWKSVEAATHEARIAVNGKAVFDAVGKNPAVDVFRLLHWLANQGAVRAGGIRAGTVVTTGSLTGVNFVTPPVGVHVELPGLGTVSVWIE